jgi:hypothetical protein
MYVFNIWYLNVLIKKIHYVTLNGFENSVIICWYNIFYELFVLCFIIRMYYAIQNEFIFLIFFSFGQNMRQIMMLKKRKCHRDVIVEMYWNARFTCNVFQFKYSCK